MIGVLINAAAVALGSLIGLLLNKGLPEKLTKAAGAAIALCVAAIGIRGVMQTENELTLVLAMVTGTILGTLLDLDRLIGALGLWIEKKFQKKEGETASIAQGFVSGTLVMCVGSMAFYGPLAAVLEGDNSVLYVKSLLDLITSATLAASLGGGVLFSAVSILAVQGGIALFAGALSPVLASSSAEIIGCGSLITIGLGLNLLGVTKLKIANMIPAVFLVPLIRFLISQIGI